MNLKWKLTPALDDIFDQLCDFPWPIEAFSVLRRYVSVVNEFLPHSTAQQIVRLKARIKSETDAVAIGEFESKIESLTVDSSTVLPRLVWGGVIVSIYTAFEFGVDSVFRHWQTVSGHLIPFDKFEVDSRKSFLTRAKMYAETQIGVQSFLTSVQHERLTELKHLRNSFVHNGGQVTSLRGKLEAKITNKAHPGLTLEMVDGYWIANARSAEFYLLLSENVIHSFSDAMVNRCVPQIRK